MSRATRDRARAMARRPPDPTPVRPAGLAVLLVLGVVLGVVSLPALTCVAVAAVVVGVLGFALAMAGGAG